MTPPIQPGEGFQVTVRVSVRRILTGEEFAPDAVGSFDIFSPLTPKKLGEAAIESVQMLASGRGGPMTAGVRGRSALREFARRPEVQRGVAVLAAALRLGAAKAEAKVNEISAQIIHVQPSGAPPEEGEF